MDTIPQDVWPVIANFLDDTTKRQMRLANTKWFNIIKYNNFNIYFARKEDIPVITERLSKYSWPIKLGFLKSKFDNGLDIVDYLPKITNLIELNADSMDIELDDVTSDRWMQLSTLSNLQVCGFLADYLPRNLWHNFPKLTEWQVSASEEELAPIFKQMSNLKALQFFNESTTWPFALVPYPEKLTRLWMSVSKPIVDGNEMFNRLTNLKDLRFYNDLDARSVFDLKYATALEACSFYGATLPSFATNTNLTHLIAGGKRWTSKNAEDVEKLTKLQSLIFVLPSHQDEAVEFNFMSHLKQLRTFSVENDDQVDTTGVMDRIYEHLSHSLKSLTVETELDLGRLVDLDLENIFARQRTIHSQHLSTFSNLTFLSICHYKDVDLNSISGLTKLEDLTLEIANEDDETCENYKCEFLQGLTNLTHLALYSKFEKESFWNIIGQLTKIQCLKISDVDNDDRLLLLTSFKNLTTLEIDSASEEFSGIHFTALTSLQGIWYRNDGSRLVHKKEDIMKTMPYLISYSYFIPLF